MHTFRTDQYIYVEHGCPMRTDLQPSDDLVEVILGEVGDDMLRLVMDDPATLLRLGETIREAHSKLTQHLREPARHLDRSGTHPGGFRR